MTNFAAERGDGMCRLCLRDLFRHGHAGHLYCDACLTLLRRKPGVDPATVSNGRTERILQERPASDPSWRDDALCHDAPAELFMARPLVNARVPDSIRAAAHDYCDVCPVRVQCGAEADEHRYAGLWGGSWRYEKARNRLVYVVIELLPIGSAA